MFVNKVLLLTLAIMALVSGSSGALLRNNKNAVEKRHLARKTTPLSVTRMKGKNGEPDEVEVDAHIFTCKKGSDKCKKFLKAAGDMEEVTKEEFAKNLADGMLGKLEEDEEKGDRKLSCYDSYYADSYYYYWSYNCW